MKNTVRWIAACTLGLAAVAFLFFQIQTTSSTEKEGGEHKAQNIREAFEDNFQRTKDPALGYPPSERLLKALQQTKSLQQRFYAQKNDITRAKFEERGPNNIGGRTRTILIDSRDPERKTIWAGSVSGGLWKTEDITANDPQWTQNTDYLDNIAVGAMAQDPDNPSVMYLGTGEGYPNADAVRGIGIFKSTDGGESWEILPSTVNSSFWLTQALLVHPSGSIYAGTSTGLYRSDNGGNTWMKVLGGNGVANWIYDVHLNARGEMIVSNSNSVYRSTSGDPDTWEDIGASRTGFPNDVTRVEVTVAEANPDILYIVCSIGGAGSPIYRSIDGGTTWVRRGQPTQNDFTNGQAWYDLEITVDPFNDQHIIVGGVPIYRSFDGGSTWDRFANNMHVDQHLVLFDKEQPGVVYFGNDGGIYRSENGSATLVQNRNLGYNVTQFYAGAIHPDTFSNYILGGTQDNNSLQLNDFGITSARSVNGGDGFYCHIDEDDPNIQLVSSQFGNYALSLDGGKSFSGGASLNGRFSNPSDYDSKENILYAQTNDGDIYRWKVLTGSPQLVDIKTFEASSDGISTVQLDPNTDNRLYLGTFSGKLLVIDNANIGSIIIRRELQNFPGVVSSVAIQEGDPNHLLVTMSNYGLQNNVYESKDGGQTWRPTEGNLPDMPVRWGIFSPADPQQALLATELGVWVTEKLDGNNTVWLPPVPELGTPLVRTDMLQYRTSDNVILAATHGRGMFTTDVFARPRARFYVDRVHYLNSPLLFRGDLSLAADKYEWTFGDGTTSSEENVEHQYEMVGEYPISLVVNDSLQENSSVKILPNKKVPYELDVAEYSGDFESRTQDYGVHTISGSAFERGQSTQIGKDGTHSGENAFVIGKDEQFYQPNTHTILYLPNFDLSEEGIYDFSFWGKWFLQAGFDGMLVEYSTDRGQTWQILGSDADKNWYDFRNQNLNAAAFPIGTPYFSRSLAKFEKFSVNITHLAGESDVAFRFVFRSNDVGSHPGLVIDDVEITRYQGKLETQIVQLEGEYINAEEVQLEWTTRPEYFAREFIVERSFNGRDYEEIDKLDAQGVVSAIAQNYSINTLGIRDLYFYRIKSISENKSADYRFEFYSPVVVLRRDFNEVASFRTFPNPFSDFIEITFNDLVNEPVYFELYDAKGRLMFEEQRTINDVYLRLETGDLPAGVYFLSYKIGELEAKTLKLVCGG